MPTRWIPALLAGWTWTLASLVASVLIVSAIGIPTGLVLGIAQAVLSLALGAAIGYKVFTRSAAARDPISWPGRIALLTGGVAFLSIWAHQAWVAWRRPVYDWDGLYYHLPAVHGWLRAGRIAWLEGHDIPFVNGYPMAVETLGFWGVRVFGHDTWVDGIDLLFWPIGVLAVALLARTWGARGAWPLLAGMALALVPGLLLLSTTAYVDAAFTCAAIGVLAWTARWLDGERSLTTALGWAGAAGLALSVKGTGLGLVGLTAIVLGVDLMRQPAPRWRLAAVAACGVLLLGGGWFVRAAVHTGNPIHPIEVRLGAKVLAPGYDARAAADLSLEEPLRALPSPLRGPVVWSRLLRPVDRHDQAEGLGPLWLLLGLPACLVMAWRRPSGSWIAIAGIGLVWWLVQPAPWWARFTLWLHGIGLPTAAVVLSAWVPLRARTVRALAIVIASCAVILAAHASLHTLRADRSLGLDESGHPVTAMERWFGDLASREGFSTLFGQTRCARGPVSRLGTLLQGALVQPLGEREVLLLPASPTHAQLNAIEEAGVEWILWDVTAAGPPPPTLRERVLEEHEARFGDDTHFLALRLRGD